VVEEPLVYPENADELFAKFLGPNHPHLRSPKFKASTPNHASHNNNNNNNGHGRSSSAMTIPTSKTHHRAAQSVQMDRRVSPPQQRSQSVTPQVVAPIAQQPATPLWGNIPRPPPLGLDDQPGMPVPTTARTTSPGLVPQRSPAASPTNSMTLSVTLPSARPVVVPVKPSSPVTTSYVPPPSSTVSVSLMSYPPMPSNAPLASSLLAPRPVQPVVVPTNPQPPSLSINGGMMMSTGISPRQPASSPPATLLNFRFDAASILDALSSPLSSQSPVLRASPPSMPIVPGVAV